MTILLLAALLPAIVLLVYVYKKDRAEKEPVGLILGLFLMGACGGPVAAFAESILFEVFEAVIPSGPMLVILQYFVGVAMVEEGVKYFILRTTRKNPNFNYVFDGVVYAVAVSLGFAALENVLYVVDGGLEVALTRAIFSVPGHCADGVVMGSFYGLARQREVSGNTSGAKTYYLLAFFLPVLEHGFYDAALSFESDALAVLALVVELAFVVFAFILVNRMSKKDTPIMQAYEKNGFQAMSSLQQNRGMQPLQPYASQPQQPQQPAQPQQYWQPQQPQQPAQPQQYWQPQQPRQPQQPGQPQQYWQGQQPQQPGQPQQYWQGQQPQQPGQQQPQQPSQPPKYIPKD